MLLMLLVRTVLRIKSLLDSAVGKCSGVKLHAIGVDSDYVHMVVSCSPYWTPSSIVGRVNYHGGKPRGLLNHSK